jgi:acyl dehydratase
MAVLTIEQIKVGDSFTEVADFTGERVERFIQLTRDTAGIHTDQAFSQAQGFDGRVVHGFFLSLNFSRILGMELPGERTVIGSMEMNFLQPVYVGEAVIYTATVTRVLAPLGTVRLALSIAKQDGTVCVDGKATCAFVQ